jgi:hypothetical protein
MLGKIRASAAAGLTLLIAIGVFAPHAFGQYQSSVLYKFTPPAGLTIDIVSFEGQQQVGLGPGVADGLISGPPSHAVYWNASGNATDLNPAGFATSSAQSTFGNVQVGFGRTSNTSTYSALMWTGSAGSVINLNPSGYVGSQAFGTDGTFEVGSATPTQSVSGHAVMWSGSNAVTDLHPTGYTDSVAYGVGSGQQVGSVTNSDGSLNAALWKGSAGAFVNLHPATGFINTVADAVSGTEQVGYGYGYYIGHDALPPTSALLWTGSAGSVVDLSPDGYTRSAAFGTNGVLQLGFAVPETPGAGGHAAVWSGTAASFVDLQAFLPANLDGSIAYSADSTGNIYGWANDSSTNSFYAVEWSPVPEPSTAAMLALASLALLRRRRA